MAPFYVRLTVAPGRDMSANDVFLAVLSLLGLSPADNRWRSWTPKPCPNG